MDRLYEDIISTEEKCRRRCIMKRAHSRMLEELARYDAALEYKRDRLREMLEREEDEYRLELEAYAHEQEISAKKRTEEDANIVFYEDYEPVRKIYPKFDSKTIAKEYNDMRKHQLEEKQMKNYLENENEKLWHILKMENLRKQDEEFRLKEAKRKLELLKLRSEYEKHVENTRRLKKETADREKRYERQRQLMLAKCLEDEYWQELERKKHFQTLNKAELKKDINKKQVKENEMKWENLEAEKSFLEKCAKETANEKEEKRLAKKHLQWDQKLFLNGIKLERENLMKYEEERDRLLSRFH